MVERPIVGDFVRDETGRERVINRTFVNPTGTGNTVVVAAQGADIKIRVLAAYYVSTIANVVRFQSATTNISPPIPLAANGGLVLPHNPLGWCETAANEALNFNMTVATSTGVMVIWIRAD